MIGNKTAGNWPSIGRSVEKNKLGTLGAEVDQLWMTGPKKNGETWIGDESKPMKITSLGESHPLTSYWLGYLANWLKHGPGLECNLSPRLSSLAPTTPVPPARHQAQHQAQHYEYIYIYVCVYISWLYNGYRYRYRRRLRCKYKCRDSG